MSPNTQRVPKKKKSLLTTSLEKGRGIDYFSLKPLKHSGGAIKMPRSTSKKALDEHESTVRLLDLEREPSDPLDATDLPLQYRPPPPETHPIEAMSAGNKKSHNFKSVSSISSFSTFSVPPSASPLYGGSGGRHSSTMMHT